ncbi:G2/mitotic-specific cyclin-A [Scaptodrosophila lebanonensis]|uniref:G2/mitotic-specific cyclin-A n=1 Tax=Drosophila lebanonensis TaxID=7225 RepID=A0A6J2UAF5_DROLE|nr:G2/mitotic-specific cyclin-A [Scaptodrosophila lebanonensis]
MATFQIHRDINDKENPEVPAALREKGCGKQPLAVIGGKEKAQPLAPRANFAVLNANNGNVPRAAPLPAGKAVFQKTATTSVDTENAVYGGAKKSNVVPVVEQFKTFSVYEDNNDTQQQVVKAEANANDKENVYGVNQNDESHVYDLDITPMSVTDVLSPMSVDRSMVSDGSAQLIDDSAVDTTADSKDGAANGFSNELLRKEMPPRNDRQRFYEVVQYQLDILKNFREAEKKHRPKPQYMRRQNDINHSMRTILVDWLVEVSEEYNLDTETLYLSVVFIDRFLSQMSVVRSKLQLVGTAAMYIASKYEEIYPPDVGEFVFITDDTYNKSQVLRMEQIILKILSFDLCTPTPYVFVNTYAVLTDIPERLKYLTLYICELSLLDADPFLNYLPSLVSAAALALARSILNMDMWTPELEEITTYKLEDLKEVVLHLCKSHKAATELSTQAIREKYNRDKYKKVSSVEAIELNEAAMNDILAAYNAKKLCKKEQIPQEKDSKSKVNLFYKF